MTQLRFPEGLSAIAGDYDSILCDVWGVIHNGRAIFAEACEALVKFRAQGGHVCLITNAPVPKAQAIRYFEPSFDDCVTSGDATRAELKLRSGQSVWRLGGDEGWEHDRFLYEGLDLKFDDSAHADLLLCIGLRDMYNDQPEEYRDELKEGVDRGLTMICANPATDIRGATRQGFDSLYVGTGLKEHGPDFQNEVTDLLADYGENATYAMSGLRW